MRNRWRLDARSKRVARRIAVRGHAFESSFHHRFFSSSLVHGKRIQEIDADADDCARNESADKLNLSDVAGDERKVLCTSGTACRKRTECGYEVQMHRERSLSRCRTVLGDAAAEEQPSLTDLPASFRMRRAQTWGARPERDDSGK